MTEVGGGAPRAGSRPMATSSASTRPGSWDSPTSSSRASTRQSPPASFLSTHTHWPGPQDAFCLHDQSIADPHYLRIKTKQPEQYQTIVRHSCRILRPQEPIECSLQVDAFSKFDDPRKELSDSWTKFAKFQPLWKIRNYFGEKIAMYFAWQVASFNFLTSNHSHGPHFARAFCSRFSGCPR